MCPDAFRLTGKLRPGFLQRIAFAGEFRKILPGKNQFSILDSKLDFLVLFGFFSLPGNGIELGFYFFVNVVEAEDILPGCFHFSNSGIFTAFVFGYPGGVFNKQAAVFRFGLHHGRHGPLFHQGISSRTYARAHEELFDVQQPARNTIDAVFAFIVQNDSS